MDIRNIKLEKPLEYNNQFALDFLYKLNLEQLEAYKKIEGLPEPPLELNIPKSQIMLKDFIGRVIEEISEGYESLIELTDYLHSIGWNMNLADPSELVPSLQNANEEQADALGFFLTLLIYSNIQPEDIVNYIDSKAPQGMVDNLDSDLNDLDKAMAYGIYLLKYELNSIDAITTKSLTFNAMHLYRVVNKESLDQRSYKNVPLFNYLNPEVLRAERELLWIITYQLNISRNLLKNRSWKLTQVMTKEIEYQESLVKAFLLYLGYLGTNLGDNTYKELVELFYLKQQLNIWRQQTNY